MPKKGSKLTKKQENSISAGMRRSERSTYNTRAERIPPEIAAGAAAGRSESQPQSHIHDNIQDLFLSITSDLPGNKFTTSINNTTAILSVTYIANQNTLCGLESLSILADDQQNDGPNSLNTYEIFFDKRVRH